MTHEISILLDGAGVAVRLEKLDELNATVTVESEDLISTFAVIARPGAPARVVELSRHHVTPAALGLEVVEVVR